MKVWIVKEWQDDYDETKGVFTSEEGAKEYAGPDESPYHIEEHTIGECQRSEKPWLCEMRVLHNTLKQSACYFRFSHDGWGPDTAPTRKAVFGRYGHISYWGEINTTGATKKEARDAANAILAQLRKDKKKNPWKDVEPPVPPKPYNGPLFNVSHPLSNPFS